MTCGARNTQASLKGLDFFFFFISSSLRSCGFRLNPQGIRLRVKGLCELLIKHITVLIALLALVAVLCKPGKKFIGSRLLF
jgi:hypothetical protein